MHRRTPLHLSGGWRSGETGAWPMAEGGASEPPASFRGTG